MSHSIPKTGQDAAKDPDWFDLTPTFSATPLPGAICNCVGKPDGIYCTHHKSGKKIIVIYCRGDQPTWAFESNFEV